MRKATNTKIKHWVPVSEESESLLINFMCHGKKSRQAWRPKTTEITFTYSSGGQELRISNLWAQPEMGIGLGG